MTIPFEIPAKFAASYASGELVRYGTILKDATTGRIVAHLQETSVLQSLFQTGLSFDPSGVTGLIGIAQNAMISRKLDVMQSMMGTLQVLQIATLASSVAGIGVTAATSVIILNRLKVVEKTIERIEDSLSELPNTWRDMELRKNIRTLQTAVERMHEAEVRTDAENVIGAVEEKLNYVFDDLYDGITGIVVLKQVDPELLRTLLAGLSLCGGAQIKAMIWLDQKDAAERRALQHCNKLRELAFRMPRHIMAERFDGNAKEAAALSKDCSEIRLRAASQPDLIRLLTRKGIHGRDFIEQIQAEEEEPILILPAT